MKNRFGKYSDVPGSARYMRDVTVRRTYGITLEEIELILAFQENKCKICEKILVLINGERGNIACVDHRHDASKRIRGLLCTDCNLAIGHLNDNPELCRKAATYLEQSSKKYYTPKAEWPQFGVPLDERYAIIRSILARKPSFSLSEYLNLLGNRLSRRQASRDLASANFLKAEGQRRARRYRLK